MASWAELDVAMRAHVPQKRQAHVYGVVEAARELAGRFGVSREQAEVAALLHDFAKAMPEAEQLAEARRRHLIVDPAEEQQPSLLHGAVGAALLAEQGLVTDPGVLEAIRWHTTGRVGMSRLEMVTYLADVIEPTRSYPEMEPLRQLARQDLERAVLAAMDDTIRFVLDRGWVIHLSTVQARNWLLTR